VTQEVEMKKAWEKPQLIVLVRSTPEEAVLTGCKNANVSGPGVGAQNCTPGDVACIECDTYPAS
jgi:hypothetical protein